MKRVVKLLAKNDEEIDISHLCTLVATAATQQTKADTSRKMESKPGVCVSTTQK
jgi:hypothetical protein